MAPPDSATRLRESLGRKLTKGRRTSMEIPERFRDASDGDDEDDVCTAKSGGVPLNQSIFSLIAAAGSAAALNEAASDSEEEDKSKSKAALSKTVPSLPQTGVSLGGMDGMGGVAVAVDKTSKHRRRSSKALLVKSLHKLRLKPIRERKNSAAADDMMSSSQILDPRAKDSEPESESEDNTLANAPVLSRILTAEAQMREELEGGTHDHKHAPDKKSLSLADEVQRMFKFDQKQDIIAEYRCRYVRNVDISGHIFVTKRFICFYAYLPQITAKTVKAGYISKRGMRDPRYHRFYCELKGHVLSFYEDPAQINYPRSLVDMRRSIGVFATGKGKDASHFTLETDKREYQLKADSPESCADWVQVLQQEILTTHNDGGLIKITLPIDNILDIEDNHIRGMSFADSLRIRVIDNDETYAVDEYYFAFDHRGLEAIHVLKLIFQNRDEPDSDFSGSEAPSSGRQSLNIERPSAVPAHTPPLRDSVRSTLVPQAPGIRVPSSSRLSSDSRRSSLDMRPSLDQRRRSYDLSRRSVSISRTHNKSPLSPTRQASIGSPTSTAADQDTESSVAIQSLDETIDEQSTSESQILNRSDVFQVPTIHAPSPKRGKKDVDVDRLHRASQDTERRRTDSPEGRASKAKNPSGRRAPTNISSFTEQDVARSQYSIKGLMKAGMSPLQSVSGVAGYLNKQSKQMSNLFTTESMGYYEKVASMWQGGARHYGSSPAMRPDDNILDDVDESKEMNDTQNFREHFALPESEDLRASWHCYSQRTLPVYGKLYLGSTHLCWRPLYARTSKLKLPLKALETAIKGTSYRLGYAGMCLVVGGDEEVFFDFSETGDRDDCVVTITQVLESMDPRMNKLAESGLLSRDEIRAGEIAKAEHQALQEARRASKAPDDDDDEQDDLGASVIFDDPAASIVDFKPKESLRITCLTIGSRGDVQPYIALCKRLIEDGHKPKIATHAEFGEWIRKHGIGFEPIEGDPAVLMKLCVENGMFTLSFMKEATLHFRSWIDGLQTSAWKACQNSDVIIESPSAMVGIHIAEALQIPYFRAFSMPWTRTRAFPHAFFVPNSKAGGTYNFMTYAIFDNFFWKSIQGQINHWRKTQLGLNNTSLTRLAANKVPFLYNFSKAVVRQPLDWSEWVRITGYWFLDEEEGWTPPDELANFIQKARDEGKKLVYIGFGSITVDNPAALTQTVVHAVLDNDVRCVLSKGWSERMVKTSKVPTAEIPLPPEILQVKYSVPHSWLFPRMDAITHHGGAGTTGASLRAGKPTIIKPFFGDQYFFGSRVEDLGVGHYMRLMNEKKFSKALWIATHDERMRKKAQWIGEQIRAEDGVGTAIQAIYRDLEYARSLIKKKAKHGDTPGRDAGPLNEDAEMEDEKWEFINDESDPDSSHDPVMHWDDQQHGLVLGQELHTSG